MGESPIIGFRVPKKMLEEIDIIAESFGLTRSEVIRRALTYWLTLIKGI